MLECAICGTYIYDEFDDLSNYYDIKETLVCIEEDYGSITEYIEEAYGL